MAARKEFSFLGMLFTLGQMMPSAKGCARDDRAAIGKILACWVHTCEYRQCGIGHLTPIGIRHGFIAHKTLARPKITTGSECEDTECARSILDSLAQSPDIVGTNFGVFPGK